MRANLEIFIHIFQCITCWPMWCVVVFVYIHIFSYKSRSSRIHSHRLHYSKLLTIDELDTETNGVQKWMSMYVLGHNNNNWFVCIGVRISNRSGIWKKNMKIVRFIKNEINNPLNGMHGGFVYWNYSFGRVLTSF